jgi:RimJ/RimL family protein N-acetyltransferase
MQLIEPQHVFYSGKTVIIRDLNVNDSSLIYSWMQEKFFSFYKPYYKRIFSSVSSVRQRIQTLASLEAPFEIEALVLHNSSEIPIGLVSLSNIDTINLKAEVSIAFQRGLGTRCVAEVCSVLFHHVFSTLKLNKLYFYVTSDNFKILKLVQRYKIIQEGKLHKEILSDTGEWIDLYRFCILREDWEQSFLKKRLQRIIGALQCKHVE